MGDWLKRVARMISQKGGVFMFLRAQLSAQMATIADFLVTILLEGYLMSTMYMLPWRALSMEELSIALSIINGLLNRKGKKRMLL